MISLRFCLHCNMLLHKHWHFLKKNSPHGEECAPHGPHTHIGYKAISSLAQNPVRASLRLRLALLLRLFVDQLW